MIASKYTTNNGVDGVLFLVYEDGNCCPEKTRKALVVLLFKHARKYTRAGV